MIVFWVPAYSDFVSDFFASLDHAVEVALRRGRIVAPTTTEKDLRVSGDPVVEECTFVARGLPRLEHDYRPYERRRARQSGAEEVSTHLRCVHCHAVACGDISETDPCIEPYHHEVPHRTRLGVRWAIGTNRPKPVVSVGRP